MVWAEVAKYVSGTQHERVDDGQSSTFHLDVQDTRRASEGMAATEDFEALRPPYIHAMLAGALGGTTGDMLMHSLDTVKTRQQGDPHMPPKYTSLGSSYWTILRQEGVRKGLYGGGLPAFLGSFSGTLIFFGTYEWTKRTMLDLGINPSVTYLTAGFVADLAASPLYVPSEVLKTRLQLQGRYNNQYFNSGYNYRGMTHAIREIVRHEGPSALFHGFKATLVRDLPYSALQFAFYEQEQKLAKAWVGKRDIGLTLEILTGASAGCLAGVLTCPLDVVKTRIQTQHNPDLASSSKPVATPSTHAPSANIPAKHATPPIGTSKTTSAMKRAISTSSPSTSLKMHSAATIDASSVISGLRIIYKTEGLAGWFRGVGPRAVWTSIQSGTMLVMYQALLKQFEAHPLVTVDPI
ncbi:uncharacterized protein PV09_00845 [Verruconis gallopava]|uniref:Mitochondrial thiamine pyrophosphate carrier 1 n=1 Tax=Verruconis gallopava TaxID=253628 RepID=A0A0D2BC41_9PEZI|nr:uncharacterized protein PV09_00845 [Verruconis gallopava]KIW08929.1 hypothetical protein PV09_00845 [Verruconis gallopava]